MFSESVVFHLVSGCLPLLVLVWAVFVFGVGFVSSGRHLAFCFSPVLSQKVPGRSADWSAKSRRLSIAITWTKFFASDEHFRLFLLGAWMLRGLRRFALWSAKRIRFVASLFNLLNVFAIKLKS